MWGAGQTANPAYYQDEARTPPSRKPLNVDPEMAKRRAENEGFSWVMRVALRPESVGDSLSTRYVAGETKDQPQPGTNDALMQMHDGSE